jgi:hypothetical protein
MSRSGLIGAAPENVLGFKSELAASLVVMTPNPSSYSSIDLHGPD